MKGSELRRWIGVFLAFLALFMCAYTEHHRRLLALHESMVLGESLHRVKEELRKAETDLSVAKSEVRLLKDDMERRRRKHHWRGTTFSRAHTRWRRRLSTTGRITSCSWSNSRR